MSRLRRLGFEGLWRPIGEDAAIFQLGRGRLDGEDDVSVTMENEKIRAGFAGIFRFWE